MMSFTKTKIVPVQDVDWSVALPHHPATVDGFVELLLGHNSASVNSGLQVNKSTVSGEMLSKTSAPSAADSYNNTARDVNDYMASTDDGRFKQPVSRKRCRKMNDEPAAYGQFRFVSDESKISEELSSPDDRPRLCSVAVNTSYKLLQHNVKMEITRSNLHMTTVTFSWLQIPVSTSDKQLDMQFKILFVSTPIYSNVYMVTGHQYMVEPSSEYQ